jgi:hypothetical protein
MARIIPLQIDEHGEVQRLLPWYVVDGLDPAETGRVAAHLAACAACQTDWRSEQRLRAEIGAMSMTVDSDWARLRRRMDAAPRPAADLGSGTPRPARSRVMNWVGWAIAAQVLLILLLGQQLVSHQQPAYRTLGAPPSTGPRMIVTFRPETPERTLRGILNSIDARMVGGPTSGDAYVIQARAVDGKAALAKLRAQPAVVEAEALDAAEPR